MLTEAGYRVTLFVSGPKTNFNACRVVRGFGLKSDICNLVISFAKVAFQILMSPLDTVNLYLLNKKDNYSLKKNVVSILTSAHFLNEKLDWLHFGFAEIAVGRENVARLIGSKMAVSIRGYDMSLYPLNRESCYNLLWKRIDKLHYLSDHLLNQAINLGFNPDTKKSFKITPAVDTNFFRKGLLKNNGSRETKKILTVARLHWIKGLDDTIIALSKLDNRIDFEYHIIGEGSERERITFLINTLGMGNKVFLHGKKTRTFIREMLEETDLYIQYSENEGFCNSVLEAQSMKVLCVVANGSGLSESVKNGITGFSVEPRCPDLLAGLITKALNLDENSKKKIIESATNFIHSEYNIGFQLKKFVEFYEK